MCYLTCESILEGPVADKQPCALVQDNLKWQLADPICTFIFAVLVLLTTRAILSDIWDILMERVPRKIDIDKVERDMLAVSVPLAIASHNRSCFRQVCKPSCTDKHLEQLCGF